MKGNESPIWGEQALKGFIDRTTTYRLMLYYLFTLFIAALGLSITGVVPYAPAALLWSSALLLVAAWLTNELFAKMFRAVTNLESACITALILLFLLPPMPSATLAVVAALAMASKYILAWQGKHLFNPAALAIAFSASLGLPAAWWVAGTTILLPCIVVGGLILVYKLRKFDLMFAFGIAVLATTALIAPDPLQSIQATFQYSPLFFFALVMLTEPSTMPVQRLPRIAFGALVGVLFILAPTVGPLHISPEMALIAGNLFAFCVNPKGRYTLSFVARRPLARGIYEYLFRTDRPLHFKSGQYLEWTLGGVPYDSRGNRRFFTIASAPEEETLALGVRFYDNPSAFKRSLSLLPLGASLSVVSPAGDFVLPKDTKKKLAFLAGGIGVTPFVSMARHMHRKGGKRDTVLLYSAKSEDEVAYRDVFTDASREGLRTHYVVSENINADRIRQDIPDHAERLFYISGPPGFVDAMKRILLTLGISRSNIKTDFFPGLAA